MSRESADKEMRNRSEEFLKNAKIQLESLYQPTANDRKAVIEIEATLLRFSKPEPESDEITRLRQLGAKARAALDEPSNDSVIIGTIWASPGETLADLLDEIAGDASVPDRSSIEVHTGNASQEPEGCIRVGASESKPILNLGTNTAPDVPRITTREEFGDMMPDVPSHIIDRMWRLRIKRESEPGPQTIAITSGAKYHIRHPEGRENEIAHILSVEPAGSRVVHFTTAADPDGLYRSSHHFRECLDRALKNKPEPEPDPTKCRNCFGPIQKDRAVYDPCPFCGVVPVEPGPFVCTDFDCCSPIDEPDDEEDEPEPEPIIWRDCIGCHSMRIPTAARPIGTTRTHFSGECPDCQGPRVGEREKVPEPEPEITWGPFVDAQTGEPLLAEPDPKPVRHPPGSHALHFHGSGTVEVNTIGDVSVTKITFESPESEPSADIDLDFSFLQPKRPPIVWEPCYKCKSEAAPLRTAESFAPVSGEIRFRAPCDDCDATRLGDKS